jgi:hypothetical protein
VAYEAKSLAKVAIEVQGNEEYYFLCSHNIDKKFLFSKKINVSNTYLFFRTWKM